MWPELLGMGLNFVGGLMGNSAEKKANKQNYEIALKNYELEKDKFEKLFAEAQKQQGEGKLGMTDAHGNRVHFVEGQGWVTDLSPEQKAAQWQQDTEEERALGQDVELAREGRFANAKAQRGEGDYADALMNQLKSNRMEEPGGEEAMRNLMSAEGINEGYDTALNTAMRNAQRTGNSNAGLMADQIGAGRADALRRAFLENKTGARDAATARHTGAVSNDANLYNMFRTRASGTQGMPYNPTQITTPQNATAGGSAANQNLLAAMSSKAPQMNYTAKPEMGMANTFAGLGTDIFAGFGGAQGAPGGGYGGTNNYSNLFPAAPTAANKTNTQWWA